MTAHDFAAENDASRAALRRLLDELAFEDYGREVDGAWTVGATLAHLAYWDRYAVSLIEAWQRAGKVDVDSGFNSEHVNAAGIGDWSVLPPAYIAREVLRAAEAADALAASVSDELARAVDEAGRPRVLRRHVHRLEHIEQIRKARGD